MNISILRFPGTNCEFDMQHAFLELGHEGQLVWHKERAIPAHTDLLVVPGGFSYGDYLRSGAIAKFSPVMHSVVEYAQNGGLTLGICNGFQILLELGLLSGAMKRNAHLHFIAKNSTLRVTDNQNKFLQKCSSDQLLDIPIAHAEGNYYIDEAGLESLRNNDQIILTYEDNPNGSVADIAGICNDKKNVFGLMPHPERAVSKQFGSQDGICLLEGLVA